MYIPVLDITKNNLLPKPFNTDMHIEINSNDGDNNYPYRFANVRYKDLLAPSAGLNVANLLTALTINLSPNDTSHQAVYFVINGDPRPATPDEDNRKNFTLFYS